MLSFFLHMLSIAIVVAIVSRNKKGKTTESKNVSVPQDNNRVHLDVDIPFGMSIVCYYRPQYKKYEVSLIDNNYQTYFDMTYPAPKTIEEATAAANKLIEEAIERRGYR